MEFSFPVQVSSPGCEENKAALQQAGKIGKNSNRTVFASHRGQKVLMLPAAVSCNPWKADGFLWVNQVRPSTPSPTMQPLACKPSLKICQGVQVNQAAALLTGSAKCCWLKLKP